MASPTNDPAKRKTLLGELTEQSSKLKHLAETIDTFVQCTSFISNNNEVANVIKKVNEYDYYHLKLQAYFKKSNSGLYDLSEDSDVVPCASQDPDERLETETFKEKKELSIRCVTRTHIYVENPCFMESALGIADNEKTHTEASKFLRKQFRCVQKLLTKYFPEDAESFPSPGEGMACRETETFEKIWMPLVHILYFFVLN